MMYQDWICSSNAHHATIDGVPMKINNYFQPKDLQGIGEILTSSLPRASNSKVLNLEYSYKTEHGYLQWYGQFTKEKEEKAKKLEEDRLKQALKEKEAATASAVQEQGSASNNGLISTNPFLPVRAIAQSTKSPVPLIKPSVPSTILEPQRASPLPTSNLQLTDNTYAYLKDFESLADDPFNMVEMNTINDLEELSKVLGNIDVQNGTVNSVGQSTVDKPQHSTEQTSQSSVGVSTVYENVSLTADQPEQGSTVFSGQDDSSLYENYESSSLYANITLSSDQTTGREKPDSLTVTKKQPRATPRSVSSTQSPGTENSASVKFDNKQQSIKLTVETATKPAISPKPKPPVKEKPKFDAAVAGNLEPAKKREGISSNIAALGSAIANDLNRKSGVYGAPKGFSYIQTSTASANENDSLNNIEWPSLDQSQPNSGTSDICNPFIPQSDEVSESPPAASHSCDNLPILDKKQSSTTPDVKPKTHLKPNRPPPPVKKKHKEQTGHRGPRPYVNSQTSSLKSEDDQVTDSLLSMGFDRVQINAALRNFGCDTKKIVEHLVAIQTLSSEGINWQNAQQALFLFGTDTQSAKKYAQAYQQLIEFGFAKDKIKSALLENEMDANKALDKLLAVS